MKKLLLIASVLLATSAFADKDYVGQFDGNVDSNIENISFLRLKQLVIGYCSIAHHHLILSD